jgi:hypothetical protein
MKQAARSASFIRPVTITAAARGLPSACSSVRIRLSASRPSEGRGAPIEIERLFNDRVGTRI